MSKSNLHHFAQVWKGLDPLDCQTSWGQSAFCGPCLSPEPVVVRTGHLLAWCGNTRRHTCTGAGWSSHTWSGLSWCRMLTAGAWYQSVVLGPAAVLPLTRSLPDWLVSSVVTADSWQADSRAGTTHRSCTAGRGGASCSHLATTTLTLRGHGLRGHTLAALTVWPSIDFKWVTVSECWPWCRSVLSVVKYLIVLRSRDQARSGSWSLTSCSMSPLTTISHHHSHSHTTRHRLCKPSVTSWPVSTTEACLKVAIATAQCTVHTVLLCTLHHVSMYPVLYEQFALAWCSTAVV